MRFAAVLNGDGGTLRSLDLDALSARMLETLGPAGHTLDIDDVVVAGGGGTISAAARLMGTDKALAVLPAGTRNQPPGVCSVAGLLIISP